MLQKCAGYISKLLELVLIQCYVNDIKNVTKIIYADVLKIGQGISKIINCQNRSDHRYDKACPLSLLRHLHSIFQKVARV